jgi:hypothetical protein
VPEHPEPVQLTSVRKGDKLWTISRWQISWHIIYVSHQLPPCSFCFCFTFTFWSETSGTEISEIPIKTCFLVRISVHCSLSQTGAPMETTPPLSTQTAKGVVLATSHPATLDNWNSVNLWIDLFFSSGTSWIYHEYFRGLSWFSSCEQYQHISKSFKIHKKKSVTPQDLRRSNKWSCPWHHNHPMWHLSSQSREVKGRSEFAKVKLPVLKIRLLNEVSWYLVGKNRWIMNIFLEQWIHHEQCWWWWW